MKLFRSLCALGALLLISCAALAQDNFALKNGDRVVFYGDSITDQRLYTNYVEAYVVTRFPKLNVSFVHSGWGGDRVTGGGGGPIDVRLQRDVIAYKPTVMTIMLGMNDGAYRAFDPGIFETYAKGYQHIIDTVKPALPGVRITAIVPSPYDDVTREPKFEGGYNAVLLRYGDFVKELAKKENLGVADLNAPVVAMLGKANATDPANAQKIINDRVHPGAGGHLVMAEALLRAWNAPAIVTSVALDAANKKATRAQNTVVSELQFGDSVSWTQLDEALPFPLDTRDPVVALAVNSSDFVSALDQQMLQVGGLAAEKYDLKIDGKSVGTFTKTELAAGVNLALLPTPMMEQATKVSALTVAHNNLHFTRWRSIQVPLQNGSPAVQAALPPLLTALDADEDAAVAAQRAAAQPLPHKYELTPQP